MKIIKSLVYLRISNETSHTFTSHSHSILQILKKSKIRLAHYFFFFIDNIETTMAPAIKKEETTSPTLDQEEEQMEIDETSEVEDQEEDEDNSDEEMEEEPDLAVSADKVEIVSQITHWKQKSGIVTFSLLYRSVLMLIPQPWLSVSRKKITLLVTP